MSITRTTRRPARAARLVGAVMLGGWCGGPIAASLAQPPTAPPTYAAPMPVGPAPVHHRVHLGQWRFERLPGPAGSPPLVIGWRPADDDSDLSFLGGRAFAAVMYRLAPSVAGEMGDVESAAFGDNQDWGILVLPLWAHATDDFFECSLLPGELWRTPTAALVRVAWSSELAEGDPWLTALQDPVLAKRYVRGLIAALDGTPRPGWTHAPGTWVDCLPAVWTFTGHTDGVCRYDVTQWNVLREPYADPANEHRQGGIIQRAEVPSLPGVACEDVGPHRAQHWERKRHARCPPSAAPGAAPGAATGAPDASRPDTPW